MATALIGIGSNLGDPEEAVRRAARALEESEEISAVRCSRLYRTRPVGGPAGQGKFANAAAVVETSLGPRPLLERLREVEADLGRTRSERWAPRTLDLDLLLFDELVIDEPGLAVPHPRMSFRRFVLEPAVEVAPDMRHPTSGRRIGALLAHLNTAPHYVAIGGLSYSAGTWLAKALHRELGGPLILEATQNSPSGDTEEPTVPSLTRALEFVEHGAGPLHRESWQADPKLRELLDPHDAGGEGAREQPAAVSSFWLDQWRLWGCLCEPDEDARPAAWNGYRQWLEQAEDHLESVINPKLVIWLDVFAAVTPRMEERLPGCLRALLRQAACPVVLRLDTNDPDKILAESLAAIEAMQPLEGPV